MSAVEPQAPRAATAALTDKAPAKLPTLPSIGWSGAAWRLALSALLAVGYFLIRDPLGQWAVEEYGRLIGGAMQPSTARMIEVLSLLVALAIVWQRVIFTDSRFHAPALATTILLIGDAGFNILESQPAPAWLTTLTGGLIADYSPSVFAVLTTITAEMLIGGFYWNKWPHLASAYVSGISVGILIKSSLLWPFVMCGLISILSKYVLRIGNRHLWNPTNFGVTMMLFLAPAYVASLTVQGGNNGWAVAAIWLLGGLIIAKLGRFHIPAAFVLTWAPLAFLRSYITGQPWQAEIAPITSPMFQLYMFFMITDPKATTHGRARQTAVAMLVAVVETALRLVFKDVHSLYHALFIVGPITNFAEIMADRGSRASGIGIRESATAATSVRPAT